MPGAADAERPPPVRVMNEVLAGVWIVCVNAISVYGDMNLYGSEGITSTRGARVHCTKWDRGNGLPRLRVDPDVAAAAGRRRILRGA